MLGVTRIQP